MKLDDKADWRTFPSREELADGLAEDVAATLTSAIRARGRATFAVSGGSTPGRFFDALSQKELRWDRVKTTLVDERFVEHTSERSNERLVRQRLLLAKAAKTSFHPLCWGDPHNDRRLGSLQYETDTADRMVRPLLSPLDVVILGMGTDGHTASFFPDAENLGALLDPAQTRWVMSVDAPSAGEPRLTLTLPLLVGARFLAVHIEGEEKKSVLQAALEPGGARPVSAIFEQSRKPVPVYWAG